MRIIHLDPCPKRFSISNLVFFAYIRQTAATSLTFPYSLLFNISAICMVPMPNKRIQPFCLIISYPCSRCKPIYSQLSGQFIHIYLACQIHSYPFYFFFDFYF